MSACYKYDSFALALAGCNFVGVPLLVNPREHGLLAGSLPCAAPSRAAAGKAAQRLGYPGGQHSCLPAALPRSSAVTLCVRQRLASRNRSMLCQCFLPSVSQQYRRRDFFPPVLSRTQLVSAAQNL